MKQSKQYRYSMLKILRMSGIIMMLMVINPAVAQQANSTENEPSGPRMCTLFDPGRAIISKRAIWKNRDVLKVKFLGGDQAIQEKIKKIAVVWNQYANIRFEFVDADADAEIRISLKKGGSWSVLGKGALLKPTDEATMNYGWLTPTTSDTEYRRVVLHEFGHALGLTHEHRRGDAQIPWDEEAVYKYYDENYGWPREKTKNNILDPTNMSSSLFTDYDPTSIMHYAVDDKLTLGVFKIGWNTDLSELDKQFIAELYPK